MYVYLYMKGGTLLTLVLTFSEELKLQIEVLVLAEVSIKLTLLPNLLLDCYWHPRGRLCWLMNNCFFIRPSY